MDAKRWTRVEQLCQAALERDEHEQTAFLASACGSDQELRREVESLLAHRHKADTFLEAGAMDAAAQVLAVDGGQNPIDSSRWAGRLVGSYRIVAKVASGGMGDVYRATRADGTFDKQVAVKLIQGARSTDYFLSRFQNERQILATLDHPNIARLLDGGSTEEGLPYLVMEYIEGLPIDEFCMQKNLDTRERLQLFRTVCSAVQFAHQHLVVHRDLKPSNILVTADGVPKLLDFGIAKILNPADREDPAQQTMTLMRMLTPDYASPEQVRSEPISTVSDVYSLGVILYVLLTGQSPYRVPTGSPEEMLKAICDVDPEKPSTALTRASQRAAARIAPASSSSEVSRSEKEKRRKLQKILEGDLDNIVLKALRKEPGRRYASVDQFSEDIRRYLAGLPILAHKDTPGYRAHKFIGRHKWGVAAVALLILSLAAGMITTLWQARIARAERARAERRFNDVRKLANSLIFEVHDSIRDLPGATAARKLIVQRAQEYLDGLAQESQSDPALLQELAAAYARLASVQGHPRDANLGDTPKALQNTRKAVELLEAALKLSPSNRDIQHQLANAKINLSYIQANVGDDSGRKRSQDEAVQSLEELAASNPEDLKTQSDLADAYSAVGFRFNDANNLTQGLIYHQKALAIHQRLAKTDPQNEEYQTQLSFSHKRVASILIVQNQLQLAFEHEQAALAIDEAQLALHPDNARTRYNITFAYGDTGFILRRQGDLDGALSYYRKALAIRAALVAADPQDTRARNGLSTTYYKIAGILEEKADTKGAVDYFKKALALMETLSQADPANESHRFEAAETQTAIAGLYANMAFKSHLPSTELEDCREAENWYRKALPVLLQRKTQGKDVADDARAFAAAVQNREKCGRIIARLDHVPESTNP